MKRICILSIYDNDGLIDDSEEFYISSMADAVDRLIIIIIGSLRPNQQQKLKKYNLEIYSKENKGLDTAAYKEALEKYISIEEMKRYDELILSNDTNFGPLIPFVNIFEEMASKACDFWGINYANAGLRAHLQSDLRAFRRTTYEALYDYFINEVRGDEIKHDIVRWHEIAFYRYMLVKGFSPAYYTKENCMQVYYYPYQMLKDYGHPFIKKRGFEEYSIFRDNYVLALNYIRENYNYNLTYICETVHRRYGVDIDIEKIEGKEYDLELSISEDELIDFCSRQTKLYIYGTGEVSLNLYSYYRDLFQALKGFVVTDKKNEDTLFGYPVMNLSEIKDNKVGILVFMGLKNSMEVKPLLTDYCNVLFLWGI